MFFYIHKMLNDIKGNFMIFGAGTYAKEVYKKIECLGEKDRIQGFIVSKKNGIELLFGKNIYSAEEYFNADFDFAIVICVSNKYQNEIIDLLNSYSVYKYLIITDYECRDFNEWEKYKNKALDYYENNINEWCINYREKEINIQNIQRPRKNMKQIVFILSLEASMPRTIKIISALKKNGYDIVVFNSFDANGRLVTDELADQAIKMHYVKYVEELMFELLRYNPLIYYMEPRWGDCAWANIILQHKELFGKIAITFYDLMNGGLVFASKEQKEKEQWALEHADGIIWRWDSKERLEEKGMHFPGESIHFYDYCRNSKLLYKSTEKRDDNNVKICFVTGHIDYYLEEHNEMSVGYSVNAKLKDISDAINGSNCTFEVYYLYVSDDKKDVLELLKRNSNLSFFQGYTHQKLIEAIAACDYGCFLHTGGKGAPDYETTIDGRYYAAAGEDAAVNKYFDYLDAGLPIIATHPTKECSYLEQFGVLVKMDLSTLDIDYLIKHKSQYKDNVKKALPKLSCDNNIGKLINFMEKMASN